MEIKINELLETTEKILVGYGLSNEYAKIINEHLLNAELSEKPSHGFMRIPRICDGLKNKKLGEVSVFKESPISYVLDGGNNPGFVVAHKAMKVAIEKAKTNSVSIVGGFNTDNIGILGYYVREIASRGLVGIMTANSPGIIPPWGGVKPVMGTNPIAIGVPSNAGPIVLDFATAKSTFGDVLLAAKNNKEFPPNILIDENGAPTTNPKDVRSGGIGAILAIAEHKGAGLAFLLEILGGPLVNAKAGRTVPDGGWGFFLIVFDPTLLSDTDDYLTKVDGLIKEVKENKKAPGFDTIYLPGERSSEKLKKNSNKTSLNIPENIWNEILDLQL